MIFQKNRKFDEELKKESKKKYFQERRALTLLPEREYEFPSESFQDFERNFIESDKNILFIDKSEDAANTISEELIYLKKID